MNRTLRTLAVCSIAVALGGCAIGTDGSPRDIPAAQQQALGVDTDRNAGAAVGTERVYFVLPTAAGSGQQLTSVARDVDTTPEAVLTTLFAGPNAVELDAQLRTLIPSGTTLRSAVLRGGTLRVDVSAELLELSGDTLIGALAQIVFTAWELNGVRAVKIVVDGADQQWPAGNGELQSAPFTIYDYPGLLPSAQPAYPAVPTPTQP